VGSLQNDGSGGAEGAKRKCRSKVRERQGGEKRGFKVAQVTQVAQVEGKVEAGFEVSKLKGKGETGFKVSKLKS